MNTRSGDKAWDVSCLILGDLGLKITVQSNMKIFNYLDVTLNLTTGKYYPFRWPDNNPLYINVKSNHPPSIIGQIPASISTRISPLSCDPQTLINHHSYTMMPLDSVLMMKQSSMRKTGKPEQKRTIEPDHVTLFWFIPRFS